MSADDITTITLDNGLTVMLKEIHTAPIISQWMWYRVGSRDEYPGITGISHWVEHMQFKGTPRFPSGVLDRIISREGGVWNAFTYLDWTTYFETLPADKIDIALELEADRMVNSTFDAEEVASERTVIISERQGNENEPLFQLGEAIQAAAFRVHSYHHEIIGDMADLETMTRDDLYQYYRTYYVPNNALLALAGDFEVHNMLEKVKSFYGDIEPGEPPQRKIRKEPPQQGEHRITIEGTGETTYLQLAYHAPTASDEDFFPFLVLDSLMTGPSGLNMFGGGLSNKTSRLYQKLVENELAVSVNGSLPATIDPFLYIITVTVHPQRSADEVITAIEEEIQQIMETPPTEEELARAVKQARALFAYGSESITNQAFWMGFSEMFDSYQWFLNYLDRLSTVKPEHVEHIARTYLIPKNRVLGIYLPENNKEASA